MKNTSKRMLSLVLVLAMVVGLFSTSALAATNYNPGLDTEIVNLRVDEQVEPITVDPIETAPVNFSWEMVSNVLGQEQAAYQIVVTDEAGTVVWNSGKVESGMSTDIAYEGAELTPDTLYTWEVTVWDVYGSVYAAESTFETAWLSNELSAWKGADFIGIKELILDADRQISFGINADLQINKGSASVVFGGNDNRLNNQFNNMWKIDGSEGNYIEAQIDISALEAGTGPAVLNLYAPGYDNTYEADVPAKTANISTKVLNAENMHDVHKLAITAVDARITITLDGTQLYRATISSNFAASNNNPVYPFLNDVGFAARAGSNAVVTNYEITDVGGASQRGGNKTLLNETTGAGYGIFAELPGVTVDGGKITVVGGEENAVGLVDPSYYGNTMLRKEFAVEQPVVDAKVYVSAMGAFDLEINGEAVAPENYFEPGFSMYRESLYYTAYDVTDLIQEGANAIGATLAGGWYTGFQTYTTQNNYSLWGDYEALLATLVLTYEDGSKGYVVTDTSWEGLKESPIRYSSMYHGERYDARYAEAVEGFSTAAYDSEAWTANVEVVEVREWFSDEWGLYARQDAPVHIHEILTADHVVETNDAASGTFTYDMGVNMTGVPSVTFPTAQMKEGDVVTFATAEHIFPGLDSEINANFTFEKNGEMVKWADIFGADSEDERNAGIAGRIAVVSNRSALDTDSYVVSAADIEAGSVTWAPSFTFRGYQYVQITVPGTTEPLPLENVKGLVLTSSPALTGEYVATAPAETVDARGNTVTIGDLVNQLYANTTRSQLGNFLSLPTDCPQRNERMGWTGDAQVYSLMSTYASDTQNFWSTWMQALRDSQGVTGSIGQTCPDYVMTRPTGMQNATTWSGAVCMVPWTIYSQYGDTTIVTEFADVMWMWIDGMAGNRLTAAMEAEDMVAFLETYQDKYSYDSNWVNLRSNSVTGGLCDHLAMDGGNNMSMNGGIYIYLVELTGIMFDAVNDPRADVLLAYYDLAKAEWNEAFIDPATGMTKGYKNGWYIDDTQTSYASPLNYNLISDELYVEGTTKTYKEAAGEHLARVCATPSLGGNYNTRTSVYGGFGGSGNSGYKRTDFADYSITTGFNGTPNILDALSANGQNDVAYGMIQSTAWPSWLYPITQGATTVYERWDSYKMAFENGIDSSNSMNSFNHFALGASSSWFWEYSLGIRNSTRTENGEVGEVAGFKHITLQPMAGPGYTAAEGSYISNYGKIESAWTTTNATDGVMDTLSVSIPANTTATLYLPVPETETVGLATELTVNVPEELAAFVTVAGATTHNGEAVIEMELASGGYDFVISEDGVEVAAEEGYVVPEVEVGTGVTLALNGEEEVTLETEELTYTLTATDAIDLSTATLTFEVNGLVDPVVEGVNGWTVITQSYADGVLTAVAFNKEGVNGEADLVTVTGATTGETGTVSVALTEAVLSAYVGNGEAFVSAVMGDVEAATEVSYSVFDVNRDGTVDQLDITRAQRAYGADANDANWNALADVDTDGDVDITDLVLILNHYSK